MALPSHVKYLVIGAGVHGLSTAYHLALELQSLGRGSGRDIIVVDKTGIAAGASGIACGVVRNNYFQPAMRDLMAHSVEVWETDPEAFSYHSVGYMQISPEVMHEDVATIFDHQQAIGYPSVFVEGESECSAYMREIFHDWQAKGITSVLHEKKGGYANNCASMRGLAAKAEGEGVKIFAGIEVRGFKRESSGSIARVETNSGTVDVDYVVVGVGPWIASIWKMLDLPSSITVNGPNGTLGPDVPMWTFWALREGTLGVDPSYLRTNGGDMPPVMHVDSDEPLYSDVNGSLITDQMWGIYYKPDFDIGGVQGGAMPDRVDMNADDVAVDPYGPESKEFVVDDDFAQMWCSALASTHKRFEGKYHLYRKEPSGGIGAFTPDSFPVFDVFHHNAYVIADSNHGYKMLGVGKLVAEEICGRPSNRLEPFRFARYAEGKPHPVSNSPFPWS